MSNVSVLSSKLFTEAVRSSVRVVFRGKQFLIDIARGHLDSTPDNTIYSKIEESGCQINCGHVEGRATERHVLAETAAWHVQPQINASTSSCDKIYNFTNHDVSDVMYSSISKYSNRALAREQYQSRHSKYVHSLLRDLTLATY